MKLLLRTLQKEIDELIRNNVKLVTIGETETLPKDARLGIEEGIQATSRNTGLILNLALSYGGREEILSAVHRIADQAKAGQLNCDDIDAELFRKYLYTADLPDPDLLIRTSGELRISNFLLWQLAYTEIYITHVLWPDFRRQNLYEAVENYQNRERRFGKVSEQIVNKKK
jgi:undecaprenyl diphosphate synthase